MRSACVSIHGEDAQIRIGTGHLADFGSERVPVARLMLPNSGPPETFLPGGRPRVRFCLSTGRSSCGRDRIRGLLPTLLGVNAVGAVVRTPVGPRVLAAALLSTFDEVRLSPWRTSSNVDVGTSPILTVLTRGGPDHTGRRPSLETSSGSGIRFTGTGWRMAS